MSTDIQIYTALATVLGGYILGSFPAAYIAGRLRKGVDIREVGTRNMGAMNVFREVGIVEGVLVLIVDMGKGMLVILLARWMAMPQLIQLCAGGAVVLGHSFPVFLKFRGGKGGATSAGILFLLMPGGIPFYAGAVAVLFIATRHLTFAYGVALACFPFIAWVIYHSVALLTFSLAIVLFLIAKNVPGAKEVYRRSLHKSIFRSGIEAKK